MQNTAKTALHCAALLAFAALPLSASAATPEETFIAQTHAWADAYNTGTAENTAKIVAMYADDAVLMPPDAPPATDHDAMFAFLTKDMANSHTAGVSLRMDADTAGSSGSTGWHSGTYSVLNKDDGKVLVTGKYVEVWQKQADGQWKMIRDIWNNDASACASAPTLDTAAKP